jgi:asparagine synthase (glutamine-hydrolysing)
VCGIAGLVARGGSGYHVDRDILQAMSAAVAHRGPDGSGAWYDQAGGVAFAHRRLAVVDLSERAAQPMLDTEGSYCLVFNGEIYNHHRLRSALDAILRPSWRTDHSDTEVLLYAFKAWGSECLRRLEGMFAFAIYDLTRQELFLARDRVGVKPLYFAANDDHLTFASEVKALLVDPAWSREIDEEALFHYLSFLVAPAPMTMYKQVHKLPPGSWLRMSPDGSIELKRWWDPFDNVVPHSAIRAADASELVRNELGRAVQLRKMADVPVGIFLSGGVDSSTNAALFSYGEGAAVRTFSVGYDSGASSYPSELAFAKLVAEELGAKHHEVKLSADDLMAFLPAMASLQDEPLADPVCFPLYHLGRAARQSDTPVVQVGEGADELFAGYPRWHKMLQLQRVSRLVPAGSLAKGALYLAAPLLDVSSFRYEYARRAANGLPVFWGGAEGFGEKQKKALLGPELRRLFAGTSSWDVLGPIRRDFLDKSWDRSDLSWMTYLDLRLRLPELLLMRIDKMTMAWGVEARVPFLDSSLVSTVLGLPASVRLGNEPKGLLKESVRDLLPAHVLTRPKQGFGVPLLAWMSGPLGQAMASTLEKFCQETDLLDIRAVQRVLSGPRRSQAWYLFNLALWWEAH